MNILVVKLILAILPHISKWEPARIEEFCETVRPLVSETIEAEKALLEYLNLIIKIEEEKS